jgi:serine/threonine protein kinase
MKAHEIESELWGFFRVQRRDEDVPSVVGRYRIESVLGGGGMGTVFKAYDERVGRSVALKIIRPVADPATQQRLRRRFRREAKIMAGLDHPRIVRVLAYSRQEAGEQYLVMELLESCTLHWATASLRESGRGWATQQALEVTLTRSATIRIA